MEHAILHETIDGQRVNFYPETGFDDVLQTDGNDEITLRMVLEGMDAAIALLQNGLAAKANAADVYTKDNLYTKIETNNLLSGKSNKATTLAGYGITNAYTKKEVDNSLDTKANKNDTYTKTEVDNSLDAKANKNDTYTKTEVNDNYRVKTTFIGLEELGISGNCTLNDVFVAFVSKGNNTQGFISQSALTSGITDLPAPYGLLHLSRVDERIVVHYYTDGGKKTYTIVDNASGIINKGVNNLVLSEEINSSNTNYIRYESGLQICFGNASGGNGKVNTHTFPQAFTSLAGVTCTGVMGTSTDTFDISYSRIVTIRTVTNTNFTWQINGITSNSGTGCRYIAIGYWK